uniref:Putative CheW protein (CheW) n=1 Tax=Magnetococcus massalia (strain MO-1) TaxID=451514 RepID=A0A1S7LNV2_MAGMO|nr:putative CheW protein (cheW) [Candidatus Magnetococcus massalia]
MLVSTFTLGELYLGIDIILVREINRSMECTPVPGAPDFIRGMLNIRGRVITLFDLKSRLGWSEEQLRAMQAADSGKRAKQYNVIMKTRNEVMQIDRDIAENRCNWQDPVGLVVDQLGDVRDIVDDTIQPPPANLRGISADFVHGVVEFDRNLLVILDVVQVLGLEQNAA